MSIETSKKSNINNISQYTDIINDVREIFSRYESIINQLEFWGCERSGRRINNLKRIIKNDQGALEIYRKNIDESLNPLFKAAEELNKKLEKMRDLNQAIRSSLIT